VWSVIKKLAVDISSNEPQMDSFSLQIVDSLSAILRVDLVLDLTLNQVEKYQNIHKI
jgi:hypothetical protein